MIDIILGLLEQKKEFFIEYKQTLEKILDCTPEEMEYYSQNLEGLQQKIDAIDIEVKSNCENMGENGENIILDIKNKSKREDIGDERKAIYDLSQSIYNIISSTTTVIEQIKLKANQNMNEAMSKIKSLTDTGKGVLYLKAVDSKFDNGTFLNIKK